MYIDSQGIMCMVSVEASEEPPQVFIW